MNAIEQMMQAHGANAAQSMAALLGGTSAGSINTGFAEQFAAALQNTGETSPFAQAISNGSISIYAVTNVTQTQTVPGVSPQQQAGASPTIDRADLPEAVAAQLPAEGFQLVKVTPENFATLFGNNPTATQEGVSPSVSVGGETPSTPFLVIQTPNGNTQSDVHLLPVAELEALLTASPLVPQTTTTAANGEGTSPVTAAANGTTPTASISTTPASVATATSGQTTEANTALDQAIKTPAEQNQTSVTNKPEASASQEAAKSLAERAGESATTTSAKDQPATTSIKAQKVAEAEAHGVQTQQAANTAKKPATSGTTASAQQTNGNAAAAASNTQSTSGGQSNGEQSGSQNQSAPDQHTATPAKSARAASAGNAPQAAATNAMQQPPVTWTPERVSGFGEGFSADTFAGGLSGLRGESSFLSSMGILGGKASPHMGAQVAKQLNLQVTNAVKNGSNEFTMRLDPAELGRVQVKMKFSSDGTVAAQVMVERPETLSLLQREVRGLERAIETGGHQADENGISFSLDTSDGESAGKAFAEAMHEDRLKEQLEQNSSGSTATAGDDALLGDETNDPAVLEEILSRVTPETGLDVRI
ncbi:MAG: flagellar hook-length control protein FliK [Kordiimonas sp.]